jgi:hypothetical protein
LECFNAAGTFTYAADSVMSRKMDHINIHMRKNEYILQQWGQNKILCSATHKKSGLSAWGTTSDPEENKRLAISRLEELVAEHKKSKS